MPRSSPPEPAPSAAKDLVRRLRASGLRLQKRRGDTGVARAENVVFADGSTAHVDLIASARPADEARVFAAMVFVRDAEGSFAVVHSVRRAEWGAPGGWRDGRETVPHNAVREVREETGIVLDESDLTACGYERFHHRRGGDLWQPRRDLLQAFRTDLGSVRPVLQAHLDDTSARRWVTSAELAGLCRDLFWWPLAAHLFDLDG